MRRMIFCIPLALGLLTSCGSCLAVQQAASAAVVDCTARHQDEVAALVLEFRTLLSGDLPDWRAVESRALHAGRVIGGCALARFVDSFLVASGPPTSLAGARSAAAACEVFDRFRASYGGVRYRTEGGVAGEGCHGS
jgi:hypothetical protein